MLVFLQVTGGLTLGALLVVALVWAAKFIGLVYDSARRLNDQAETNERRYNRLDDDIWALKHWKDSLEDDAKKIAVKTGRKATL